MKALKESGMESSNLIIGIDFTGSNLHQGQKSFGGKSLHSLSPYELNPYQRAIQIIGRTLEFLDEDNIIPCFGFGDIRTKNHSVFPILSSTGSWCHGVQDVLKSYESIVPNVQMSGPTNFAPIINKAIQHLSSGSRREYHILIILTDGQVTDSDEEETIKAIVKATNYPLSIITIGVGDGPYDKMEEFDDLLPSRKFDNFQFVNYHKVMSQADDQDSAFALAALMEIPDQFREISRLKLL